MKQFRHCAVLLLIVLVGCGGGRGHDPAPVTTAGQLLVTVQWPPRPTGAQTRLLPVASNSLKVTLTSTGALQDPVSPTLIISRPQTTGVLGALAGDYAFRAEACPNADGTGVPQAAAEQPVTLGAGVTSVNLTLASTIDHIEISPNPASVYVGAYVALTATAVDAQGDTVVVCTDSPFNWSVTSGGDKASVDEHSGVVTGSAEGSATVQATEPESGALGTSLVQVGQQIDPRLVGTWQYQAQDLYTSELLTISADCTVVVQDFEGGNLRWTGYQTWHTIWYPWEDNGYIHWSTGTYEGTVPYSFSNSEMWLEWGSPPIRYVRVSPGQLQANSRPRARPPGASPAIPSPPPASHRHRHLADPGPGPPGGAVP
jgi:hypothetical protein